MWKSLISAFGTYSRIPMPSVEWKDENIRYIFAFFPFVGLVIGLIIYFCALLPLQGTARGILLSLIPIFVTGGIHMEGLMDVADAKSSFQPLEKKQEILKDPHCGAFGIISCVVYMLACVGLWSVLKNEDTVFAPLIFFISRTLGALSLLSFKLMKNKGMAYSLVSASPKCVKVILCIYMFLGAAFLLFFGKYRGIGIILGCIIAFLAHIKYCRDLGGINGDLAGNFIQLSEILMLLGCVVGGAL